MSNRAVKHSSRYQGPAGDSRPAAEIFSGIEEREKEAEQFQEMLMAAFDTVFRSMTLSSPEDRILMIWYAALEWRMKHDIEFRERVNGGAR